MLDWDDETKLATKEQVSKESGERDRAYLIVLAGSNVGEMFKLHNDQVVIGRGQGADIQILDDGVSRRHCVICSSGNEIHVEDPGSRNGTFVNGEKVSTHVLRDGDKIQVGSTTILKFTYHDRLDESFQQQMYESALRDGLTRTFNKKYFLDRLESEFRFAKRHRVPLAVVMFDIDHFKRVNDTLGHLAGDFVLAQLSRRVLESIRTEDVLARYGGEEFAVLCRAIALDGARAFAERIRTSVQAHEFLFEGTVIPVTVSVGVAGLPRDDLGDSRALLAAADEALYEAKRTGRNRTCVSRPLAAAAFEP